MVLLNSGSASQLVEFLKIIISSSSATVYLSADRTLPNFFSNYISVLLVFLQVFCCLQAHVEFFVVVLVIAGVIFCILSVLGYSIRQSCPVIWFWHD